MFDYEHMTKRELLEHVTAYAEAIHDLSGRCMAAENRLKLLERTRNFFERLEVTHE